MKTWPKALLMTLAVALPAFAIGPIIWPPETHGAAPLGLQRILLMTLAAIEALALGLGIAFIGYGLPLVQRAAPESRMRTWVAFIATAWLLISWWPHGNMHRHNGMDLDGLLVIDYLFHVPMIAAGVVMTYILMRTLTSTTAADRASYQQAGMRRSSTSAEETR